LSNSTGIDLQAHRSMDSVVLAIDVPVNATAFKQVLISFVNTSLGHGQFNLH
jgi:hypothetical protein